MDGQSTAFWLLENEAHSLLARLARVRPFALIAPMVAAATVPLAAQTAMENQLIRGRQNLRRRIDQFIGWLRSPAGRDATPAETYMNPDELGKALTPPICWKRARDSIKRSLPPRSKPCGKTTSPQ